VGEICNLRQEELAENLCIQSGGDGEGLMNCYLMMALALKLSPLWLPCSVLLKTFC